MRDRVSPPPTDHPMRQEDDEAFRQFQRDRIAEANRFDAEQRMCLTCATSHYCPKHNPEPATAARSTLGDDPMRQEDAPLPPLPEGKGKIRHARHDDDDGGWIVDFDCEGPLWHHPGDGDELFTADQMREYAKAARSTLGDDRREEAGRSSTAGGPTVSTARGCNPEKDGVGCPPIPAAGNHSGGSK